MEIARNAFLIIPAIKNIRFRIAGEKIRSDKLRILLNKKTSFSNN